MTEIQLFGRVGIVLGEGTVAEFETRKVATVAAVLGLRPGKAYDRQTLADTVWPESDPEAARASLRQALSSLRKTLGGAQAALQSDRSSCRLDPGLVRSDADRFLTAVRGAALEPVGSRSPALQRALDLYRGRPLEGLSGAWVDWARDLLRKRVEACRQELVEALIAEGRLEEACEAGMAALAARPWSEALAKPTIQALAALGRTSDAAEALRTHAEALWNRHQVAPSRELRALVARAGAGSAEHPGQPHATLPSTLAPIIGREQELDRLASLLDPAHRDRRLVTVTGVGGVGKTRLATEAALRLSPEYGGRVSWCDLSSIHDPELILPESLTALGLRPNLDGSGLAGPGLGEAPVLLVLDNLEQFDSRASGPVTHLLRLYPNLRVLATSRMPLEVEGEVLFRLDTLATEGQILAEAPAVRLFVDLAHRIRPDFTFGREEIESVADICRQFDGLPLAIRLAASRIDVLTPDEIRKQASDRFSILSSDDGSLPERHRSLISTIRWTYDMLPSAKLFFAQLSAFPGTFTLEACQAATSDGAALETLQLLVRRSLVVAEPGTDRTRYRLLATVRDFAQRVVPESELPALRDRYVAWYLGWAERLGGLYATESSGTALREFALEYSNVRQAFEWALESAPLTALRIAYRLGAYFDARGLYKEGLDWLTTAEAAAEAEAPADLLLQVAADVAQLHVRLRQTKEATRVLERRAGLLPEVDPRARGVFLFGLGSTHLVSGSLNEALEVFLEVGRVLEGEDEERFVAAAKGNVALAKLMLGDLDAAQETAEEALRLSKEVGSRSSWGSSLYTMAHVAMCRGDVASAERLCRDSIATLEEGGLNAALSGRFTFLSELLTSSGDYAGALESLHRSVTRLRDLHMERDLADCARAAGRWCLAVGDFRDAARFLAFYSPFPAQGFHGRSKADPRPDPSELLGQAKAALRPDEFEACCRDGRTWTLAEMLEAVLALAVPEPVRRASGKAKA